MATAVLAHCDAPVVAQHQWSETAWGDFQAGSWWRLADVVTLDEPIPWEQGQLGLWRLPNDIAKRLGGRPE